MKRFSLILLMLVLVGMVYADGPRYRFRSRRALQSLWRKEQQENKSRSKSMYGRSMTPEELQGEGNMERDDSHSYGVVATNPFSNGEKDSKNPFSTGSSSSGLSAGISSGKTTDGGLHIIGDLPDISDQDNPFIGGTVDPDSGQGEGAPPVYPVGDGIPVMILLTAAFIAIKKRT